MSPALTAYGSDGAALPVQLRENPFLALGTPIPANMQIKEALEYARMADWNVHKQPHRAVITDEDGRERVVALPHQHNVVRTNPFTGEPEVLGVVGDKWTPFNNEEAAFVLEGLSVGSGAELVAAGPLRGGRKTFLALKLPEDSVFTSPVTGAEDATSLYLALFNNHDGGGSLTGAITPIRVFCANQQRMIERTARSRFSLRHTGDVQVRMAEIKELLSGWLDYRTEFDRAIEQMIDRTIDDEHARHELNRIFVGNPVDLTDRQLAIRTDTVDNILGLYHGSETVAPFIGTAYGLYNAITEYTDHYMRVVVPEGSQTSAATLRAVRAMESSGLDELKQRAFQQLMPVAA